jgi:small subunit ribosomal protein S1
MLDKKHDNFFDEESGGGASENNLMNMLADYDKKEQIDLAVGAKATGKVVRIGGEFVFLDVGGKNEAVIKKTELADDRGETAVKEGDIVVAYVASNDNNGIVLSKALSGVRAPLRQLAEVMNNKVPVQGRVTGINKGGFNVKVMGHAAFCPVSQIALSYVEDLNVYLGKTLPFVIMRIAEKGRNIVVSRVPILEEELRGEIERLQETGRERKILSGKITRIAPFGLFVDIGNGIEGLVHISEVSWSRAENLADSFAVGQTVECLILDIERREPLRQSKISLSIKQALEDPWSGIGNKLSVGESREGVITRIAPFGAFVELLPGVEGLIHISEMSWSKKVRHPSDVVSPGQRVNTLILSIDEMKKTIGCSLKDVTSDPWIDAAEKFSVGSTAQGTVASKSRYGYFVDLAEGVTGLLVFANISADKKEAVPVGGTIEVSIESIDPEKRRIGLSYGLAGQRHETQETSEFLKKQHQAPAAGMSEFGAALKAAMGKNTGAE